LFGARTVAARFACRRNNRARFDVARFERGRRGVRISERVAAFVLYLLDFAFDCGDNVVEFLDIFQEIADVQEGVAIETDLDEGRLHAGQHACDTAFVNASN